jgi:hypothetical protein
MNLKKMLLLTSMALAAVAFSVPATAQAQVGHGLFEGATRLGNTAPVTLTSTNLQTTTPLGTLSCAKVSLHYHVEHNGNLGNHVLLAPTNNGATENAKTENCVLNGSTPVAIGKAGTHTVTINTSGHGVAQSSFSATVLGINCTYSGGVTIQATDNSDIVHVGPSNLTGSPAFPCGNGTMSGTFTMETPTNPAVPIQAQIG